MYEKNARTRVAARDLKKEQKRLFSVGCTLTLVMFLITSLLS